MPKSNNLKDINTRKIISRIAGFAKPFIPKIFLVIILNTIFSTFSALSIAIVKPLLELIFNVNNALNNPTQINSTNGFFANLNQLLYGNMQKIIYNPKDIYATLLNLSLLIISIFILKNISKFIATLTQVKFEEGLTKHIRDKVFASMTYLSLDFFIKNKEGTLLSAITNDINVMNSATFIATTNALREILQIIIFILLLLSISPYLTLIAFSTSIISFFLIKISVKYIRRYATRMQEAMANYTSALHETIAGIKVVKAYNAEENAIDQFKNQTTNFIKSAIKHRKITAIIPSINEILAIFTLCVVLFIGGNLVLIEKQMTGADLMAFLFYLFAIMSPVAITIDNLAMFQRGFVAADRILKILDTKPTVKSGNKIINKFNDKITIDNVSFSYEKTQVIHNVSIEIPKNSKIAFVGTSGSGKSTMLDLIIRFYDPTSGKILLDGIDIKEFDLKSYRNLFGIVSQDTILFNDTIYNNIKYGLENIDEQKIIETTKIANAFNFINALPNKFNTIVGDRGIALSGGERQRIAIARALIRNPQILIFDEATSALDSESEKIVQDAINNSLKDKTAIIVAHRFATIIHCDIIYVFENGSIVEYGTHQQLYEKNGNYRKLFDIQFAANNTY